MPAPIRTNQEYSWPGVWPKVWVVFCPNASLWWTRFLKPGFRHCFAILHDGKRWLALDPLSPHMDMFVFDVSPEIDLPAMIAADGLCVVAAPLRRQHKRAAPPGLFTCVEAVKRLIGLHHWRVFTPWQLFRTLTQESLSHVTA